MANVTRIKAKDEKSGSGDGESKAKVKNKKVDETPAKVDLGKDKVLEGEKVSGKDDKASAKAKGLSKADKKALKVAKKAEKKLKASDKKPKKVFAPFRYIRDSWREIRQVRWPDRKATWKMTLSVIVYVVIFGAIIMLLDMFFTFIFNLILGE